MRIALVALAAVMMPCLASAAQPPPCVAAVVDGDNGRWVPRSEAGWFGTNSQQEQFPVPVPENLASRAAMTIGGNVIKDKSMRALLRDLCGEVVTVKLSLQGPESGKYRFTVGLSYSAYQIVANEVSGKKAALFREMWSASSQEDTTEISNPEPVYLAVDQLAWRFMNEAERTEPMKPAW